MKNLKQFNFKNQELLRRALTHRSYINEHQEDEKDNERLEFLGDALLNFLSAEYLFKKSIDSETQEGEMTRFRSTLVDKKQLAKFAIEIGLTERIRFGKGAMLEGGNYNEKLLSSTFEAIIAAYYLDQNCDIEAVRQELIPLFDLVPQDILKTPSLINPKGYFQELVQAEGIAKPPHYKTERIKGTPDHKPSFKSLVYLPDDPEPWGRGKGSTKKEAETLAAENAIDNWLREEED
jgi:ribonuclease-3